jgi:phosphoribosylformylglycinamidine synthase
LRHYDIYVTAKQGIFDPAGATAAAALDNLGFTGIEEVKIGKYIQLKTADEVGLEELTSMCEKLLANPVIEDFSIHADTA